MFFSSTLVSVILGLMCQSMFSVWICLELNLLSFVGILALGNSLNTSASLKYFLVQSLGSGLFLFGLLLGAQQAMNISASLIIGSLSLKMAGAPFYGWLLLICQELEWESFFLLSSVQKVLPLSLILKADHSLLFFISSLSALMAAVSVMTETSLKKTMALSSVFGLAWFLASSSFSLALGYLIFYSASFWVMSTVWSTMSMNEFLISQLSVLSLSSFLFILLSLLNFSGLPPFSLFYFKLSILSYALSVSGVSHISLLLVSAVVFIYIYLRIGLSQFQLMSESPLSLQGPIRFSGLIFISLLLASPCLLMLYVL